MTIEAQRAERESDTSDHATNIAKLVKRVIRSLEPAYDGSQLLGNEVFARRLVAALIALRVIREHVAEQGSNQDFPQARSTEQDQPKKQKEQRNPVS